MKLEKKNSNAVQKETAGPAELVLPENPVYRIKIRLFNDWNGGRPVTGDRILKFYDALSEEKFRQENGEPYSNASINIFLAAVKESLELTFPEFASLDGKTRLDRFFRKKMKYLPVEKTVDDSKIFSSEELKLLADHADHRTWVFIKFLYNTGMRISEALDVRIKDISCIGNDATVKVRRGKRGRERKIEMVPVSLLKLIQNEFVSGEYLFQNHHHTSKNGKYSRQRWFQKLSELSWEVLGRRLSPHLMRHSHATALAENGVSYGAIQKRLGHKRASTTLEIYDRSKVNKDQLEKIMEDLD